MRGAGPTPLLYSWVPHSSCVLTIQQVWTKDADPQWIGITCANFYAPEFGFFPTWQHLYVWMMDTDWIDLMQIDFPHEISSFSIFIYEHNTIFERQINMAWMLKGCISKISLFDFIDSSFLAAISLTQKLPIFLLLQSLQQKMWKVFSKISPCL